MKKILVIISLCLCFVPFLFTNYAKADESSSDYVVVGDFAVLYELPDFSSTKLEEIKNGETVSVKFESSSPVEYGTTFIFYKVSYKNNIGYVVSDLIIPKSDILTTTPNYNAKTNADCMVYFMHDQTLTESEIFLPIGQRIFLYEGFDNKAEYTPIAFVKDNQVLYGYLKTDAVSPDGINPIVITCILIAMSLISISLAWAFIKTKKIRLKKKKNKENLA